MSQVKISECIKKIDKARGQRREEKSASVKSVAKIPASSLQKAFTALQELNAMFEKINKLRNMSPYNKFRNIRPTMEAIINCAIVPNNKDMNPFELAAEDAIIKFVGQCRIALKWAAKNIQSKGSHQDLAKQVVEAVDFKKPITLQTIYLALKAIERAGVKQPKEKDSKINCFSFVLSN